MERVIERGAGLDVHKKTVTACVRVPDPAGERRQEVQTFGTTAAALLALRDWLQVHGVTHVAMESTGVYWKPVYYVLEELFNVSAGQRRPREQGPRAQDRCTRLRVAGATAGARAAAGQVSCRRWRFGSCGTSPGIARSSCRIAPERRTACTRCSPIAASS